MADQGSTELPSDKDPSTSSEESSAPSGASAAESAPSEEAALPEAGVEPAGVSVVAGPSGEQAPAEAPGVAPPSAPEERPTFLFFGLVTAFSLLADVASKAWAEVALIDRPGHPMDLINNHLAFIMAYNPGGAWGLLEDHHENLRKPFFLLVSVGALIFIVSLYSRLAPGQWALKWGLPLVLGGALGNLSDRITRGKVVDFIDYRADWVESMNRVVASYAEGWTVTDHWPTFNVADIAICVGVGLMAVDMFTHKREAEGPLAVKATVSEPPA